ncbi:MAG: hypothetical protein MJZ83_11510 [Bacteroidaceae bacterium]|nr:hypothetical protein [Bacteroidaceae bacterium]
MIYSKRITLFFFLIVLSCISTVAQSEIMHPGKDSILQRVDELKALVDRKYWPSFNAPEYVLEMNYYEEGPFRMHLVQNDSEGKPRMECSSPEITFRTIPDVTSYEEWYAMLIHECFHGFQYKKYPQFWKKMLEATPQDFYASDSLKALKKNYSWYREILKQENELLTQMLEAPSLSIVGQYWQQFMPLRKERLQLVKEKLGLDLEPFYSITEAMEGSARYIEYSLYKELGISDKAGWMTNLEGDSYYYASGFYMILILEKFSLDFKDKLFSKYYSLTDLISELIKTQNHPF